MVDFEKQKTVFVSFVGAPNAGKSTLTNHMVGTKVSIVTPKVQTTRNRIAGIVMEGDTQLVLVDTPGIFKPKKVIDKAMVKSAWGSIKGADVTAVLVDSKKGVTDDVRTIVKGVQQREGKAILLLNKVDKVSKDNLLLLTSTIQELHAFDEIFMISALKGDGVEDVKRYLLAQAKVEPWAFPEDEVSDMPLRMLAAEVTREQLMMDLQNELPYELTVETEKWEEKPATTKYPKGSVKIDQVIYVSEERHKKIAVGKHGALLKSVGEKVRKQMGGILGVPVHLFLFVKVDPHWQVRTSSMIA